MAVLAYGIWQYGHLANGIFGNNHLFCFLGHSLLQGDLLALSESLFTILISLAMTLKIAVVEVLVDFFGMDHQHQQRLQMDQQLHIVIAQHTR